MPVIYTAVSSFDPTHGDDWTKYVKWSGLTQLTEVVSLDLCLCPSLVPEIIADDWNYCVNEDYKTNYFTDCDYLIGRLERSDRMGILALMKNPTEVEVESFRDNRFEFRGFDLVELQTSISALLNCGGFPKAFSSTELSECGLLSDHSRAIAVQRNLLANYPDEPHAKCDVWAIWRMKP